MFQIDKAQIFGKVSFQEAIRARKLKGERKEILEERAENLKLLQKLRSKVPDGRTPL